MAARIDGGEDQVGGGGNTMAAAGGNRWRSKNRDPVSQKKKDGAPKGAAAASCLQARHGSPLCFAAPPVFSFSFLFSPNIPRRSVIQLVGIGRNQSR